MLKGKASFRDPSLVDVTLSMTATVQEWSSLLQQLSSNYSPSYEFAQTLRELLSARIKPVKVGE